MNTKDLKLFKIYSCNISNNAATCLGEFELAEKKQKWMCAGL